jgi:5-hydroxyisourate hydrolase-like protein (transthyretin family)
MSAPRALLIVTLLAALTLPAAAGTLTGAVTNGTNGKPGTQLDVTLISLAGGMQELTSTKTDADGRFVFNRPELGQGPMLVRVTYQGVNYHQAAPPGRDTVEIKVYEAGAPASAAHVTSRTLIFQPSGGRLLVGEDFVIENATNPPTTYANSKGTFEFELPVGAQLGQVSASSPGGMPTTQGTMDRAKNRYAVDFPLKPGESNIRISYDLPYDGDRASVRAATIMSAARVMLAAPVGVQISGDGFAPAGTDQGFTLMTRENVGAGTAFNVSLSGSAPAPAQGQGQSASGSRDSSPPAGNVQVLSPRVGSFQWIVLGGMGVFFLAGFFFLMRQQRAVTATPNGAMQVPAPAGPAGKKVRPREAAARPSQSQPGASVSPAAVMEEAERGARMNLEELKDTLFRLELRRQAGTVSDQDYARERSRIEAFLRDLVRG